jgi:hypothetical protein
LNADGEKRGDVQAQNERASVSIGVSIGTESGYRRRRFWIFVTNASIKQLAE